MDNTKTPLEKLHSLIASGHHLYTVRELVQMHPELISSGELLARLICQNHEADLPAMIKFLLDKGADVNSTYNGNPPLYCAVVGNHNAIIKKQLVKLLLAHNDIRVDKPGVALQTPLFKAVENGEKEIVKLLLSAGADVNQKTSWGRDSIWRARRQKEMLEILKGQEKDDSIWARLFGAFGRK